MFDDLLNSWLGWFANAGLTKIEVARLGGIPNSTLRYMGRPDWNPTLETLRKLDRVRAEFVASSSPPHRPADLQTVAGRPLVKNGKDQ